MQALLIFVLLRSTLSLYTCDSESNGVECHACKYVYHIDCMYVINTVWIQTELWSLFKLLVPVEKTSLFGD
jgi:hypothetical protein